MAGIFFLFLDGVGLGKNDPEVNPFVRANMPTLHSLLGSQSLTANVPPFEGDLASLIAVDPNLGIEGTPQSATGQATLLTGTNVPQRIGRHYGPKPNPEITKIIKQTNLFQQIIQRGGSAALLNAYPPQYFQSIDSGRRLYSAIPLAANAAGLALMTFEDLQDGRAFSVDFTGEGWASQPGFPPAPVYTPEQAGIRMAEVSGQYDFSWFDYWISDYAGHKRDMARAVELLENFDKVLGGLAKAWESRPALLVLTSDHGNLEDLNKRGHTNNPVPAMLLGPLETRRAFSTALNDLTDFAPAVMSTIFPHQRSETDSAEEIRVEEGGRDE